MSTIVTRAGKGSPLTNNEIDSNFTNLNTDKLEDGDLSVTTNSAGTAALSYTSGVFTYTPPDLSGYAALSGATFTGEVEATGFNGDLTGAILFKGQAGEALTKGDPVYISGISGNTTIVSKADADDASKMPCFGIVDATVNANAACSVVTFGTLQGLDTSSFSEGDELFVSATGTLTTTAPTGESALLQKIAKVTKSHASSGSVKVGAAGRTNATPNLDDGNFFLGNSSNQAVSADFSTSVTNIALPLSGGALTGAVTTSSTFDGRDVATDGAKLDGIEASADVTDTANVTAAGALMDSELTSIASVKALNQGVATTDSPTFAGINATGDMTVDVAGDLTLDADGGEIFITDAGSEKARFSAGNLLIDRTSSLSGQSGSVSANTVLSAHGGLSAHATSAGILEHYNDETILRSYGANAGSGELVFKTGGGGGSADSEAARIDSSGTLLIGTSDGSGAGLEISKVHGVRPSVINNVAGIFNRMSSDGPVAIFRKDGTTVGSIGTQGGDLYLGTDDANIKFYNSASIQPVNSVGGVRDNAIDIGSSNARFRSLYLSGTVRGGVETAVTSTSTTITSGTHLYVSAAGQTITLPASPSQGAKAHITVGNFTDTVVARNGSNIMGDASDMTLDAAYLSIQFIYVDATRGWVMA